MHFLGKVLHCIVVCLSDGIWLGRVCTRTLRALAINLGVGIWPACSGLYFTLMKNTLSINSPTTPFYISCPNETLGWIYFLQMQKLLRNLIIHEVLFEISKSILSYNKCQTCETRCQTSDPTHLIQIIKVFRIIKQNRTLALQELILKHLCHTKSTSEKPDGQCYYNY